jgi:hypothetical protein
MPVKQNPYAYIVVDLYQIIRVFSYISARFIQFFLNPIGYRYRLRFLMHINP